MSQTSPENIAPEVDSVLREECGGRPPIQIWGTRGMVSSMHPIASQIGGDILRNGGNAVDAAVAVGAAISVLSPDWAGPAGDSAWLVYLSGPRQYYHLDGYSTCPGAISPTHIARHFGLSMDNDADAFREEPPKRRNAGMITAMTPGTPAAWVQLARKFGQMPLEALLDPAIDLAKHGFLINDYLAAALQAYRDKLVAFRTSREIFFQDDKDVLTEGMLLRQPELGETLRRLGQDKLEGFYGGETAARIVEHSDRQGGKITSADLRRYCCKWREVLHGSYRDRDIFVTSPPTAGIHVIQALNILEGYKLRDMPYHGTKAMHLIMEALKLVLADRRNVGGDPDFISADTTRLSAKDYAAELRGHIDETKATPRGDQSLAASSTTHFSVADAAGNMVSATQTLGSRFGCGDTIAGTGLLMNDRTWWMSLAKGPNQVSPNRRANIGHAPTIVADGGFPTVVLGSPGGFGVVQYVVQVLINMLDYQIDIQHAIEAPRFKIENLRGRVGMEKRFADKTRLELAGMGHDVFELPAWTDRVGGVEGVAVKPNAGCMLGGYDPRRNSMAVGLN